MPSGLYQTSLPSQDVIQATAEKFRVIGSPDAEEFAGFVLSNPQAAYQFATKAGGWHAVYGQLQRDQSVDSFLGSYSQSVQTGEPLDYMQFQKGLASAGGDILKAPDLFSDIAKAVKTQNEANPFQAGVEEVSKLSNDYENEMKLPRVVLANARQIHDLAPSALGDLEKGIEPSPVSQIGLVFSIMKIFDPNSVVRESEGRLVYTAQNIPDQVRSWFDQWLNGSKLKPTIIRQIVDAANRAIHGRISEMVNLEDVYRRRKQQYGIPQRYTIAPDYIGSLINDFPDLRARRNALAAKRGDPIPEPPTEEELDRITRDFIRMQYGTRSFDDLSPEQRAEARNALRSIGIGPQKEEGSLGGVIPSLDTILASAPFADERAASLFVRNQGIGG